MCLARRLVGRLTKHTGEPSVSAKVELENIEKSYGATQTLRSASLTIEAGEFMTLVGPSGCGKSTLLRIMAGLQPQSAGEIRIDGTSVDHLRPRERDIAMVFQSYALYPHMSVEQNIGTPLRIRRLPTAARLPVLGRLVPGQRTARRQIQEAVREVADQVEIGHLLPRKPAALSGGQRQRVALARAIIRNPKVFLMDEPLSNLDARLRVTMRGEITSLHRRLGATFIYVTHDQTEAMTMSDRVAVMMDGEIVQCASPQELYTNPQDLRVARFIGSPEINVVSTEETARWTGQPLPDSIAHIAFRPEALDFTPKSAGIGVDARLLRHELLGHDVLVFLQTDQGTEITGRIPAAQWSGLAVADGRIAFTLRPEALLAFAPSGKRAPLPFSPDGMMPADRMLSHAS
ncbi:glycerol-3-phosphate ABC transporter ATP-binding protein [Stappia taiwanensis]|nr:glycerol-3-phosphate ABC transporter ATP-binding protein [Stappia taiwanensis]